MKLRVLNAADVSRALTHAACVEALRPAMMAVSSEKAVLPLRQFMGVPHTDGKMGLMPGYLETGDTWDERNFGVKIVSKFPREKDDPNGTHVGMVVLFRADIGVPIAIFDGGRLTAIRTASATALATDALARNDAKTALFMGHGEEAEHHVKALLAVRPIERFLIWGRSPERAGAFAAEIAKEIPGVAFDVAEDAGAACAEADVICTLTSAPTPIFKGAWLKPGQHINMVGAAVATSAEVDTDTVVRSRWYTDYKPSLDAQGGEWIKALKEGAVSEDHLVGELGAVLSGAAPGRQSDSEITAYKSLGVTAQDLCGAKAALAAADAADIGQIIDW
ncbi:MAG: ornithine cyclodeaminase family protein [Pseudomonadota bacterium]